MGSPGLPAWEQLNQEAMSPPPMQAPPNMLGPDPLATLLTGMKQARESKYEIAHPEDIAEAHEIQKEGAKHLLAVHKLADQNEQLKQRELQLNLRVQQRKALQDIANSQNPYNPAIDNQPTPAHTLIGSLPADQENGLPGESVFADQAFNAAKTAREAALKDAYDKNYAQQAASLGAQNDILQNIDPAVAEALEKAMGLPPGTVGKAMSGGQMKILEKLGEAQAKKADKQNLFDQQHPLQAANRSVDKTLRGQAFIDALPEEFQDAVKNATRYRLDPSTYAPARSGMERATFLDWLMKARPDYMQTNLKPAQAYLTSLESGKDKDNLVAVNTAINHLGTLKELTDALKEAQGKVDAPIVNKVVNKVRNSLGDSSVTNYQTAANALSEELAKSFRGGGNMSIEEIKNWQKLLSDEMAKGQITGSANTAIKLLSGRISPMNMAYKNALKEDRNPEETQFLTPESIKVLTDLGYDPGDVDALLRKKAEASPEKTDDIVDTGVTGVTVRRRKK